MRNHLGSYECKLCLTLHTNEGNYLAHTQGKRHQSNLGRRAAMEAKNAPARPMEAKEQVKRRIIKIGRPGYKVRGMQRSNYTVLVFSTNIWTISFLILLSFLNPILSFPYHIHPDPGHQVTKQLKFFISLPIFP